MEAHKRDADLGIWHPFLRNRRLNETAGAADASRVLFWQGRMCSPNRALYKAAPERLVLRK